MKINVDFEFAFSADNRKHSTIIDLDDLKHAELLQYIDLDYDLDELTEQIEDELPNYLQYDVIMKNTKVLNAVKNNNNISYDLELIMDGVTFKNSETVEEDWLSSPLREGENLVEYIEDRFSETHHNFDVYLGTFTITK